MEYKNLDVFVLTYNRAEYLKIMLDSLCTQTATGFNIKVLNNCSTDNTIEVVKDIQKKHPERNIQIITNEKNLGNAGNFKRSQELFNNGPFPKEVANVINDIYNLSPKHRFVLKPLLWNFAYFLYKWSKLKNYETWDVFKQRLLRKATGGIFSKLELFLYQQKWYINLFNNLINKRAIHYRKKVYKSHEGRF